jgi:hypothetical protein
MALTNDYKGFFGFLVRPRGFIKVFIVIVTLIAINYSIFSLLAPIKAYKGINNSIDSTFISANSSLSNKEINILIKEKAFYDSRLKAAKSDSLVLTLNFPDSLLNIEIKGVPIHGIKLLNYELPNFYSMLTNDAFIQLFSEPQTIVQQNATAKKEPIKVVNAPKDTNEYNSSPTNTNYDTSLVKLTYVEYQTDKGFRMIFIPVDDKNFDNWKTAFRFNSKLAFRNFIIGLKSSMLFIIPQYHPTAKIYMSQDDILSIHRALPEHAEVCIHY